MVNNISQWHLLLPSSSRRFCPETDDGNYFVIAVIESDIFGGFFVTNAVAGVQTIITATGSDDMVGFTNVQFTDVPQEYHLGDVRIWMDY